MAKEPKKIVSFRFGEDTIRELNQLTKRHKISQANLLAILIHFAYAGEDMEQLENWLDIAKLS